MDTLPPVTGQQVLDWTDTLAKWMHMLLNPATVALIVNTGMVMTVEAFDHVPVFKWLWKPGTRSLTHLQAVIVAWVLTIPVMGGASWAMHIEFRGASAGFAFLSGPVAYIISEHVLKRFGIDLAKKFHQDDIPPDDGAPVA